MAKEKPVITLADWKEYINSLYLVRFVNLRVSGYASDKAADALTTMPAVSKTGKEAHPSLPALRDFARRTLGGAVDAADRLFRRARYRQQIGSGELAPDAIIRIGIARGIQHAHRRIAIARLIEHDGNAAPPLRFEAGARQQ